MTVAQVVDRESAAPSSRRSSSQQKGASILLALMLLAFLQLKNPQNALESTRQLEYNENGSLPKEEVLVPVQTPLPTPPPVAPDFSVPLEFANCTQRQLFNINLTLPNLFYTQCPVLPWVDHWIMTTEFRQTFTSVFIGCNKGLSAIEAHHLGARQEEINRSAWANAYLNHARVKQLRNRPSLEGYCQEMRRPSTPLVGNLTARPDTRTFCVEPLGLNAQLLRKSRDSLGLAPTDFAVHRAVLWNVSGYNMSMPTYDKPGLELKNIYDFTATCRHQNCTESVPVVTLDQFVADKAGKKGTIHFLSIKVEGYEVEILQGGAQTLPRVQYLEFDYNKVGNWTLYNLNDTIAELEHEYGFICYFIGIQRAWRINGCWRSMYEDHKRSSIGCVNNNHEEARPLLHVMEKVSAALIH